jgi:light-regulated signal transduction histidine kinase (bacteriophytochrome)
MRVPFNVDDLHGEFRCESRTPREPSFELHAAAELFAQLFAMRLEIDHLRNG